MRRLSAYEALTLFGRPFQGVRLGRFRLRLCCRKALQLPLPPAGNAGRLCTGWVWARPCSLAATWGFEVSFFSSGY